MSSTQSTIRHLFKDVLQYNASDPTIRLVMLLTVFLSSDHQSLPSETLQAELDLLHLGKLTRADVGMLLLHPHMEKPGVILEYLKTQGVSDGGSLDHKKHGRKSSMKGMPTKAIKSLIEDISVKILERDSKVLPLSYTLFSVKLKNIRGKH